MANLRGGMRQITIDRLSVNECEKAIAALRQAQDNIARFSYEFIEASLEFLKKRAAYHLRNSPPTDTDDAAKKEIIASFETFNDGKIGRLVSNHEKAAFLEFGVGIIGEEMSHVLVNDGEIAWEYNQEPQVKTIGSKRVSPDLWSVRKSKFDEHPHKGALIKTQLNGSIVEVSDAWWLEGYGLTQGYVGAAYMYNALVDYTNRYQEIGRQVLTKILKK
jgi:hypothetical protein